MDFPGKQSICKYEPFNIMTLFHIHSAYYLVILYSFSNSYEGLK
ncbi:hypothetical protein E2C01_078071 [Portunus trituberculatus]|uniref:Uncharacterized protein n=1 Tax=Portunus trituberculatus TaxID=210409 RepID=A0A5B7IHS3_PORTR|nr:hypothetical protein [Portunus trituberculatus]